MSIGHMVKYHVLISVGVFVVLLVVGVPLGTAIVVGMMTGCMSMMVMMMGGGMGSHGRHDDTTHHTNSS
jgi:hypothetical protein